jgi:hypothetical protein
VQHELLRVLAEPVGRSAFREADRLSARDKEFIQTLSN